MNILMVCLGNICRSPLAEEILKSKLPEGYFVDSAGTISLHEGKNPDHRSIAVAKQHGLDISAQRSRPITKQDFEKFDKIYCMDLSVYQDVISIAKDEEQRQKTALFLTEAGYPDGNNEVPDPYWSEMDGFEKVYQLIDDASERIAAKLIQNS